TSATSHGVSASALDASTFCTLRSRARKAGPPRPLGWIMAMAAATRMGTLANAMSDERDRGTRETAEPTSSHRSAAAAGWECPEVGTFRALIPKDSHPLSWLSPVPLWKARNDVLARWLGDPTNAERRRWVASQRARGIDPHFTVRSHADHDRVSLLVLGDPGEGDASQYCVVPGLLRKAEDTSFMVIASDVIYPAGDSDEYGDKFYRPYQDYPRPIFAVPGNHDWYDGLNGFMRHFCGADRELREPPEIGRRSFFRDLMWWLFWRDAPRPREARFRRMRGLRGRPEQQAEQPGPYFAIEAGPVLLVGVDTGITGDLDRDQGAWLERISRGSPKPKILITGVPIYANGAYDPGRIEGSPSTVDDIVAAPEHNYIAVIGGNIHNYQRYPVRLPDGRTILHLVSGGGGAFMHPTHVIPRVDLPGMGEESFRCYPNRGDSLSIVSQIYQRRLGWLLGCRFIPPDQAAALVAERLGTAPARQADRAATVSDAARRTTATIFGLPTRFPGELQEYVRRFFDWNDPPMFKSFLRVDASPDEVAIRCFAATGCRPQEVDPPLEDELRCLHRADGRWAWVPEVTTTRKDT
ncbi:MAG: metallophosphoesterase family protein, partial [Streptosporangiaceae bacterium]